MVSALLSSTHFLAELPVTASEVKALLWIIGAGVVVGGLNAVKVSLDIVRYFKGDPPGDQKYASKAELAAVEARAAHELNELKLAVQRERSEFRETLKEIFDRVDGIGRSVGRIEGRLEGLTDKH